jgi:ubiquinone/menaquinone biosynthesis C-methylase UbiE/catechol 2,3-dioxygenase-like lactoylglutathione lyase family enzyme
MSFTLQPNAKGGHVSRLDHVCLRVPSLPRARAFYEQQLQGRVVFELTQPPLVILQWGSVQLELEEDPSLPETVPSHLGFRVSQLETALEALGRPVLREPYEPSPGIRQAIVLDPDGVQVQLTELQWGKLLWHRLSPGHADPLSSWRRPWVPALYDLLVRGIYLPVGGEPAMRAEAISALGLRAGERVLELGCGTGRFTERLVRAGAGVLGVDGSPGALARARRRAPTAEFLCQDLRELALSGQGPFDWVLLGFVLHELEPSVRQEVLRKAHQALKPGGRLVIVDHAVPSGGLAGLWRRMLLWLEPPTVRAVIERGYEEELGSVGLQVSHRRALAHGTAAMLVAG